MVCPGEEEKEASEDSANKGRITIEWLDDVEFEHGYPAARTEGARVSLDGEVILDLQPKLTDDLYEYADYSAEEVYLRILTHLGYEVDFEFDEDFDTQL